MRLVTAAFLLTASAGPALAACPGQNQRELDSCAGNAAVAADAKLNATYQTITGRLKANNAVRTKLVAAERAWIAFRDAECAFAASGVEGGTIQPMIVAECRAALAQQRQDQLAVYLNCQEGDTSCPVPRQ
jgi:uncharacterized protein YecT (DUF1311 family)